MKNTKITVLHGGAETYAAILKRITAARKYVWIANFCMKRSQAFDEFYNALLAAAERGVVVKLLFDAYGSSDFDTAQHSSLKDAGVEIVWFRPFGLRSAIHYNQRMHKKIIVIDGDYSYTGGIGIADYWLGDQDFPLPWRDTHFEITGEATALLEGSFVASWNAFSQVPAKSHSESSSRKNLIINSQARGLNRPTKIRAIFKETIDSANELINITTAYFAPDKTLRKALTQAAERGVRIRILTNGPYSTNSSALEAGKHFYKNLIQGGLEIYEYQPTMIHAKITTVDKKAALIGSANLNYRSSYHDEEVVLKLNDTELAKSLDEDFETDLSQALKIDAPQWSRRPLTTKAKQTLLSSARYLF